MAIYALVDPRTDCISYIGQANDVANRYHHHLCEKSTSRKNRWIRGLLKLGLKPVVLILEETDHPDRDERFWISSLRAAGAKLLNMNDGGAVVFTPEVRAKMRQAQLSRRSDPVLRAEHDRWLALGREPAARAKMAATKTGKIGNKLSQTTRNKIGNALRGKVRGPMSDEHKKAISKALKRAN